MVLDEVGGVVGQGAAVQGVKHGVAGTIGSGSRTVGLTTLTVVLGLTSESALVDLTVVATREGETIGLQLAHSTRSLTTHVVNSVLVTEPIGSLHGIVEVPSPIISVLHINQKSENPHHVTKSGVNTSLGSDGVGTGGEQLGNHSSLESLGNDNFGKKSNTFSERPIAARRPAPPAPTTTQSYSWSTIHSNSQLSYLPMG